MNRCTLFILSCLTLAACQDNTSHNPTSASQLAASTSQHTNQTIPPFNEAKPTDIYQQYAWLNRKTAAQLAQTTPEQANKLYDAYRQESDEILQQINNKEIDLLQNYTADQYWTLNEASGIPTPTPIMQHKQNELAKVGLRLVDVGGGLAEIAAAKNTESLLFADKVSPDYRDFIQQQDIESNTLAEIDDAIVIPWADLGARVAFWEKFIKQYPQSPLAQEAQQRMQWNAAAFLFGTKNTPIEVAPLQPKGDIQEEVARNFDEINHAWTVFSRQYPQSPITALIPEAAKVTQLPLEARFDAIQTLRHQHFPALPTEATPTKNP